MERFDIAVIGAGPAGASSAISLARKGYSVILLEKALFPREKLCGDFLNPANGPLFQQLGVADALLSLEHEKVTAFRISTDSGAEAVIGFPCRNGKILSGLGLRRSFLDDLLLRVAEREGARLKQGCRVKFLAREAQGWSIMLEDQSTEERIQSVFLIGADGRNSWVAHRLGLAWPCGKAAQHIAFQLHLRGAKGVDGEVQIHSFPGGYAGLVGLGGGATNLCFTAERRMTRKGLSLDALLANCLYKNPYLREALRPSEIIGNVRSAYPIRFSPRRFYGDGYLTVGDAARVTEPVTGEGVYFALKSGIMAAEAIDLAFKRGNSSSQQLSCYASLCQTAFSSRLIMNKIIRALVYRPYLLSSLLRFSSKTSFPLRLLVYRLCGAMAIEEQSL